MIHTVVGLKWIFSRYANHECVNWILRLAICRECTYYAIDIERDCQLRLAILWGQKGQSMHHHNCCVMYNYASLIFVLTISNMWINVVSPCLCEVRQNALLHVAWIAIIEDRVWLALFCPLWSICAPCQYDARLQDAWSFKHKLKFCFMTREETYTFLVKESKR